MTEIRFKIFSAVDHELSQEEIDIALECAEVAEHSEEVAEVIRLSQEIAQPQTEAAFTHT